jgi:hypothetical protein
MIENAMNRDTAFPVYVRLDDGQVIRIDSIDNVLHHLEAIDIENDEYMFWDAKRQGLKLLIKNKAVIGFQNVENRLSLQQAFDHAVYWRSYSGVDAFLLKHRVHINNGA